MACRWVYLKDLTGHWTTTYDWRAADKRLNP
ncbi:epoxide hydrolase N-terminal domain-containing protein [Streptosporangium canum]